MSVISFQKFCSSFTAIIFKRHISTRKKPDTKMKVFLQKRNPLTGITEWDIGVDEEEYDYHQEIARSAFADMLHDTERNQMYYRALQLAIDKMHRDGKKANVLDIGTGTGLLSMMAAKCGADTITACEAFKPMADCCLQILERNGFADKIKVIPKRSTDIRVGEGGDMDRKANILVTEVFDTELIGEGALSTFSHAHKHLLEKDCIVVPDSAVVYAQVVECPFLQRWNKLEDVTDPELGLLLTTPQKMRSCAGSAAVHDLQLSQLRRSSFRELSPRLPVFRYDWSGRSPLPYDRLDRRDFTALDTGTAQAVFMWWDLNMDPEGQVVLSCAPWWAHAGADAGAAHPEDTIPWRDHWMQAVYYLPQEVQLQKQQESTLVSCHDEYSLWFDLQRAGGESPRRRPVCECGVHVAWARTHVARINTRARGHRLIQLLKRELNKDSVVLDLNGSSLLGLVAAKMAKRVYIYETSQLNANILEDYMKANDIANVQILSDLKEGDDVLSEVTNVVFDPARSSAVLPWEELAPAALLRRSGALAARAAPAALELWARPVHFLQLHKIRVPVRSCEGFDVSIFDELVEKGRTVSDEEIEPQPLWEYPARSNGQARCLLRVDFQQLHSKYAADGTFPLVDEPEAAAAGEVPVNGFALWAAWGPEPPEPAPRARLRWDPHTRQAVHILKESRVMKPSAAWSYQVACDLDTGHFHVSVRLDD